VTRAVVSRLRGIDIRVLTLEDFIVFKVLSTRERDAEDARLAIDRSGTALDEPLLDREIERLADESRDLDVRSRWAAIRRAG